MPFGFGPSSNTWPRWPPQRRQWISVRSMPKVLSVVAPTAWSSGFQKLGQPVWLSNLVLDENSGSAQPAQANLPARCSSLSGLVNGRSVPSRRSTSNCGPLSSLCHSSSLCTTSNFSSGAEAPSGAALNARHVIVPPAASVAPPSKKPRLVSMSASIRCYVKNRCGHCGPIALAKSSRKVKLNVILSDDVILHNDSFLDLRLGSHGSTETHPDRRRRYAYRRLAAPAPEGRGLSGHALRRRQRRPGATARRRLGCADPRPDAARRRRTGNLPAGARHAHLYADHHHQRALQRSAPHPRAGAGRRRLSGQAVLGAGAGGARESAVAARGGDGQEPA